MIQGCVIALLAMFPLAVSAESKWLAVLASVPSAEQAIRSVKQLSVGSKMLKVVASEDCANLKPGLFLVVPDVFADKDAAQRKVSDLRRLAPDAYLRACEPKPGSRIQLGIDAVDVSIFDVPVDAVNWEDADRISDVRLVGSVHVWLRRMFVGDKEDPREGQRTVIFIFQTDPSKAKKLKSDCIGAKVTATERFLALSCVTETAGDNLFHEVTAFEIASGKTIETIKRCRDASLARYGELTCDAETVGPEGKMTLSRKRVTLQ